MGVSGFDAAIALLELGEQLLDATGRAASASMRASSPLRLACVSTSPSARARLPTVTRRGQPSSSASVSFSPVPASRSSSRASTPASFSSS